MRNKTPYILKHIQLILILILFVKIGGYFSIVEERSINQIFKTISRFGMTISILYVYQKLKGLGCAPSFTYQQILSPLLYVVYLFIGLASFAWSTKPSYSILQWSMTFDSLVFVFIYMKVVMLVNQYFPNFKIDLVKIFAWATFPFMLIFLFGSFIEPDTFYREMRGGEEKRLGGWIMNPNELGMLSSMEAALSYLLFQSSKRKFWPILMLLAAIVILGLTSSRSSAIGFLLIMGILVLMSKNRKLKITMFIMVAIAVPLMLKYVIFKESGGLEEVMSMTGRLPFWTALLNEGIVKEPFFGYGFMRINYTDYFQGLNTYPGAMTHNTFMQVLMNVGFVGFFVVFWQVVQTLKNFLKAKEHMYFQFFIAVFIPIIINSFTEFGIFGEANFTILFYQFLIFLFVIRFRTNHTKAEKIQLAIFRKKYDMIADSQA
ncbi:MAG: O-antigen ligase family protein [Crocinitomicaceae bacterium]